MSGKKISAEQAVSRIYNILRGMTSPKFVAAEVSKQPSAKSIRSKAVKLKAKGGKIKK